MREGLGLRLRMKLSAQGSGASLKVEGLDQILERLVRAGGVTQIFEIYAEASSSKFRFQRLELLLLDLREGNLEFAVYHSGELVVQSNAPS
eukprot:CAMPEP_0184330002 /NCGR_PEP_ID=MMETSP1049-20130417/144450_1 /TAXON_ID=77928 /ORGANISM="Proteomonas sulcata, Strain CCMP704" /LENGTH=90 /DNA_ID=CAMNT_0026652405 /DNA_START=591 /DNA_END=861 /DNA_ORIENTATION=+